jgi:hypothetical protein
MSYKGGLERPDCLAVLAVRSKEVSLLDSLMNAKIQGNFSAYAQIRRPDGKNSTEYTTIAWSFGRIAKSITANYQGIFLTKAAVTPGPRTLVKCGIRHNQPRISASVLPHPSSYGKYAVGDCTSRACNLHCNLQLKAEICAEINPSLFGPNHEDPIFFAHCINRISYDFDHLAYLGNAASTSGPKFAGLG